MSVMAWVAGWMPVLAFVIGVLLRFWLKRVWIPTVLVFAASFAAFWFIFGMAFWPWLLLYLFLCWFGCWAVFFWESTFHPTPKV